MSDWMKWIGGGLLGVVPVTAGIVTYSAMRQRRKGVALSALATGGVLAGLGGLAAYVAYRMNLPTAEVAGEQIAAKGTAGLYLPRGGGLPRSLDTTQALAGLYLPQGGGLPRSLDTNRAMAGIGQQYVPRQVRSGFTRGVGSQVVPRTIRTGWGR